MNIYAQLNKITLYIENHLEEKIDYEILAKMLGVNAYTMQRLFAMLTGVTLADYIRKRRLSMATHDLLKGMKIMDVAIKYNYESATSFSRAYEAFSGIKPSQIKETSNLKNFPRIIFNENSKITKSIDYKIIEKDKLILYGKGIKTDNQHIKDDAPKFFREIEAKYSKNYGKIVYGMTSYSNRLSEECDTYYCLYDKEIKDFEKIIIPKSKWLAFVIPSQEAKDIQNITKRFYAEFLPSCKYNLRDLPELEYYHDGITEFLVAIEN